MAAAAQRHSTMLVLFSTAFVILWLMIASGPFLWTFWGSFKVQGDFFSKADWTNAIFGVRTLAETGDTFTGNGYYGAWVQEEFWRSSINTAIVVGFAVVISLTLGTLGGYGLARSGRRYAFWFLMIALIFRAMPHITLVSGYLLPFFEWNLGAPEHHDHRSCGDQSAIHTMDAALFFPEHTQGNGRKRDG